MSPLRERVLALTGAFSGAAAAIAYIAASAWVPHAVAVLLALATMTLLARAWGERGFARLCDAAGNAEGNAEGNAARAVGVAGATGVAFVLVARLELLSSIDPGWIAATLVCAAAMSRAFAAVAVIGMQTQHRRSRLLDSIVPLALGLLPAVALVAWSGELATVVKAATAALLAAAIARRFARRRLSQERGAALAAIQQVAEIGFLAGLLAGLPVPLDPHAGF